VKLAIAALAALLFATPAVAEQKRDPAQKKLFIRTHPRGACPATGKRALPCPEWEVHHINPLYCGGKDVPANMMWVHDKDHTIIHQAMDCRATTKDLTKKLQVCQQSCAVPAVAK
jgi:5-methylcytosine-specific restriction endonuclease McrA